jgi:hypothetical protein
MPTSAAYSFAAAAVAVAIIAAVEWRWHGGGAASLRHSAGAMLLVTHSWSGGGGGGSNGGDAASCGWSSLLGNICVQATVAAKERSALVDLYVSTGGGNWTGGDITGWQNHTVGSDPCDDSWAFVTCTANSVRCVAHAATLRVWGLRGSRVRCRRCSAALLA